MKNFIKKNILLAFCLGLSIGVTATESSSSLQQKLKQLGSHTQNLTTKEAEIETLINKLEVMKELKEYSRKKEQEKSKKHEQIKQFPYTQSEAFLRLYFGISEDKKVTPDEILQLANNWVDQKLKDLKTYNKITLSPTQAAHFKENIEKTLKREHDNPASFVFYHAYKDGDQGGFRFIFDFYKEIYSWLAIEPKNEIMLRAYDWTKNTSKEIKDIYTIRELMDQDINKSKNEKIGDTADLGRNTIISANVSLFASPRVDEDTICYFLGGGSVQPPDSRFIENVLLSLGFTWDTSVIGNPEKGAITYYKNRIKEIGQKYFKDAGNHLLQIFVSPDVVDQLAYASRDFGFSFKPMLGKDDKLNDNHQERFNPVFSEPNKISDILKLYRTNPYDCITNDDALKKFKIPYFRQTFLQEYLKIKELTDDQKKTEGCFQLWNWLQARLWASKLSLFGNEATVKIFTYTSKDTKIDWKQYHDDINKTCKDIMTQVLKIWQDKEPKLTEEIANAGTKELPNRLHQLMKLSFSSSKNLLQQESLSPILTYTLSSAGPSSSYTMTPPLSRTPSPVQSKELTKKQQLAKELRDKLDELYKRFSNTRPSTPEINDLSREKLVDICNAFYNLADYVIKDQKIDHSSLTSYILRKDVKDVLENNDMVVIQDIAIKLYPECSKKGSLFIISEFYVELSKAEIQAHTPTKEELANSLQYAVSNNNADAICKAFYNLAKFTMEDDGISNVDELTLLKLQKKTTLTFGTLKNARMIVEKKYPIGTNDVSVFPELFKDMEMQSSH